MGRVGQRRTGGCFCELVLCGDPRQCGTVRFISSPSFCKVGVFLSPPPYPSSCGLSWIWWRTGKRNVFSLKGSQPFTRSTCTEHHPKRQVRVLRGIFLLWSVRLQLRWGFFCFVLFLFRFVFCFLLFSVIALTAGILSRTVRLVVSPSRCVDVTDERILFEALFPSSVANCYAIQILLII